VNRLAALLVLLLPAASPAADEYAPRDGKFSIRFPGTPKESTKKAKSAAGELKVVTATYAADENRVYMVSYTDFPPGTLKSESRAAILDGARDGLKGKDGKVRSEKDVEVGPEKYPGRDVELEKGDQRLRFRLVLRGDRLYQIAVIGKPAFTTDKNAEVFLESFELTK
jgi:hypothetical protein